MSDPHDTIFALASGAGRAGIAVYRVSGPRAGKVLRDLSGHGETPPRFAVRRRLADAAGEIIDEQYERTSRRHT